ncbi:MAG: purine-nucleoside phosphorylase [Caldisericaceae bacterium]|nr:purine-nucleoside phosphorylase [Caldisericaceae bacterium]
MEKYTQFVKKEIGDFNPEYAIVIGSGLAPIMDKVKVKKRISYKEIPDFPVSTVEGHRGELVFGTIGNKRVLIFNGRFHFYEGYSMKDVTKTIRLAGELGVHSLIVTNAAGAVNTTLEVGDIMLINDHVNFIYADNPLRGEKGNKRFVNMIGVYSREFIKKFRKIANREGIPVREGVYCAVSGPNYETLAELKLMNRLGIDAVGMSTVPEVIMAAYFGMKVLGISCITDAAFGSNEVSHEEVISVAEKCGKKIAKLVEEFVKEA